MTSFIKEQQDEDEKVLDGNEVLNGNEVLDEEFSLSLDNYASSVQDKKRLENIF
jgi:hypothetical protein